MSLSEMWIAMPEKYRMNVAPFLRKEFDIPSEVETAALFICGLGCHEAWINGKRTDDHIMDPAQTDYMLRLFYVKHDVSTLLKQGKNVLGVILGDGWFNQCKVEVPLYGWSGCAYSSPMLNARLEVKLRDGQELSICSDTTWKCMTGPIVESNIYAGERYDARLELPGWSEPSYDASSWHAAEKTWTLPGKYEEQTMPPMKAIEELRPRAIVEVEPGTWVVDFGQNFAGWMRIKVKAKAGTEIKMRFAETIFPNGMVDTASTGVFATKVEQIDSYACKGEGVETWEPRFTYHGFRYVEIKGWPGKPSAEDLTGVVVHTALEQAGSFECSDERLNTVHRMALWTHRSNMHGFPEDCPARERCGWLGDANTVCEYSIWNFHGKAFWEKYLDDIETGRARNDGLPFFISPGKRTCGTASNDWMATMVLLPWYCYVYYGDSSVLSRHWDGMKRVIDRFVSVSKDGILSGGLGDWCDPQVSTAPVFTKPDLTTTVWFFACAEAMSEAAQALSKDEEAKSYGELARSVRAAFIKKFYDKAKGSFGSQTGDAMALHFGLAPEGEDERVFDSLVKDAVETRGMHLTVGIMGMRFIFEELSKGGRGDVALSLMRQDSYPSFGDLIKKGATTLWEYWGEKEVDDADGPRSLSHPMFGGFDNWFYNSLAGIRPDPEAPGFKHFFLEPLPVDGLSWVKAHHDSPCGRIESSWTFNEDGCFEWSVTVPDGSTATAMLPNGSVEELGPGSRKFSLNI